MVNTDNFNRKFSELCSVMSNDVYKYYFYGSDEEMNIVIDFLNHGDVEYDIKSGEISIRLVKHYQKYDSERYDWDQKLDDLRKGAVIETLTYNESSKMTSIIKDRLVVIECNGEEIDTKVSLYIKFEKFFSDLLMFFCKAGMLRLG
ncbi:hypothetical protein QH639_25730 [Lysinibacillus sp. 1 U-2021]|uniref:hypothetical protein n=1 Tax=Lysinibacillus sp. 1 U-2021 TaxID=3039426 RepID=UPI0024809232|nr:hypothetical protein [Lysinibacillus sp. 1 U-2021]WGT39139.1 hypothetical protein QH639_25730 [Lysinibacillus sp. 1 U-2021]